MLYIIQTFSLTQLSSLSFHFLSDYVHCTIYDLLQRYSLEGRFLSLFSFNKRFILRYSIRLSAYFLFQIKNRLRNTITQRHLEAFKLLAYYLLRKHSLNKSTIDGVACNKQRRKTISHLHICEPSKKFLLQQT